jgi:hypothetical protein
MTNVPNMGQAMRARKSTIRDQRVTSRRGIGRRGVAPIRPDTASDRIGRKNTRCLSHFSSFGK